MKLDDIIINQTDYKDCIKREIGEVAKTYIKTNQISKTIKKIELINNNTVKSNININKKEKEDKYISQSGEIISFKNANKKQIEKQIIKLKTIQEQRACRELYNMYFKDINTKESNISKMQQYLRMQQIIQRVREESNEHTLIESLVINVTNTFLKGKTFMATIATVGALLPIIGVVALVLSAGLLIAGTSYNCEDKDLNEAYKYITELKVDMQSEINELSNKYSVSYEYKNDEKIGSINVLFDDEIMLSYLACKYDDYKFSEVKDEIKKIFDNTHSYTKKVTTVKRKNKDGSTSSYKKIYIYYKEKDLEKYIYDEKLLDDDQIDHYKALREQTGLYARQILGNPFGSIEWQRVISSPFGYRILNEEDGKEFHEGLDLAMPSGTEIKAVMGGIFSKKNDPDGYGNYIIIKSGDKQTLYGHLARYNDELIDGQEVKKGDVIGYVGSTGKSTGNHLHLGYKIKGDWYNPAFYLIE